LLSPPSPLSSNPRTGKSAPNKRRRRWLHGLLALAGGIALLEVLAARGVARERERRSSLDGLLYVKELGSGDPVVLLAGLTGTTAYWGDALDPLAATHRLLKVDALGFGHSPWPDRDYSRAAHLAALRRTLVARGAVERVTMVGHSFGAILVAHYAALFPTEVRRVVLLGTPLFRDREEARTRLRAMSRTAGLFSLNRIVARAGCKVHEAFGPLLQKLLPRLDHRSPPAVLTEGMLHTWQAFDGSLRHVVFASPIAAPLLSLGAKVTFVHGRHDGITALAEIQELADDLGATVVVTADDHRSYASRDPRAWLAVVAAASATARPPDGSATPSQRH
jgi:pimeloyl-ACP methyl ester carboxylesterase